MLPQPDRPYTLITDYSPLAISAIIEQLQSDGKSNPVTYARHCCDDTETHLCSLEGKLLAITFGISKFHHYFADAKFTLMTDNATLTYFDLGCNKNLKLACCAMVLANYEFQVKICPDASNANPDGISHANQHPSPPTNCLLVLQVSLPPSDYSSADPQDLTIT